MSYHNTKEEGLLTGLKTNELISKAKRYIRQYYSPKKAKEFEKAFRKKEFSKAIKILKEAIDSMEVRASDIREKEIDISRMIMEGVKEQGEKKRIAEEVNNSMNLFGIIISTLIFASIIIGVMIYRNSSTFNISNERKQKKNYTEKESDMLKLIQELSIIYDNTDRYLES